jgi:hypothetical protein
LGGRLPSPSAAVAPCIATAAVFSVGLALAFVIVVSAESFLRQVRRMTISPSRSPETQG